MLESALDERCQFEVPQNYNKTSFYSYRVVGPFILKRRSCKRYLKLQPSHYILKQKFTSGILFLLTNHARGFTRTSCFHFSGNIYHPYKIYFESNCIFHSDFKKVTHYFSLWYKYILNRLHTYLKLLVLYLNGIYVSLQVKL